MLKACTRCGRDVGIWWGGMSIDSGYTVTWLWGPMEGGLMVYGSGTAFAAWLTTRAGSLQGGLAGR